MDSIQQRYSVPTVKTYELTEGQQIALEFFRRSHRHGADGFICAIKYLRCEFGLGLKDAKELADHIFERF